MVMRVPRQDAPAPARRRASRNEITAETSSATELPATAMASTTSTTDSGDVTARMMMGISGRPDRAVAARTGDCTAGGLRPPCVAARRRQRRWLGAGEALRRRKEAGHAESPLEPDGLDDVVQLADLLARRPWHRGAVDYQPGSIDVDDPQPVHLAGSLVI